MKTLQRHWMASTLVGFAVLALAALGWWHATLPETALAQVNPPTPPLTAMERDNVLAVLANAALDRDALIALNLSANQAGSVLSASRTWYGQNATSLAALKATIHEKAHALRQIEQQIAAGPPQDGQNEARALAVSDLRSAEAAYDAALNPLRSSVSQGLSESQRTTWTAIRTGHGQQMPIRMLALTDAQRVAVGKATRHFEWKRGEDPAAAAAALETDLAAILTPEQQTVVANYRSNYNSASQNIASAMADALPVGGGG